MKAPPQLSVRPSNDRETLPIEVSRAPGPVFAPFFTPLNPAKRKGYAVIRLGHIALDQVLPGLFQCKNSKPVALVSGDAAKAGKPDAFRGTPPQD